MSAVRVRLAGAADAERIAGFNLRLARETEGVELDMRDALRGARSILADARLGRYYLAERGDEVCGQALVTVEPSDWRGGRYWWIQSVYVDPGARSSGVFKALWTAIVEAARAEGGVHGIRLYVHETNRGARAAYESIGMTVSSYRIYERAIP